MSSQSRTAEDSSSFPVGARTSDYDYELPGDRIAQRPVEPRDASRLLVVDRNSGTLAHRTFHDLATLIPSGDALVVNTTRVFRARLLGHRESGGPAEILLLRPVDDTHYEAMIHPGGKLRPGKTVTIAPDFHVEIVDTTPRRTRVVKLHFAGDVNDAIARYGHIPLPPYIDRADEDGDATRYQTVYAQQSGSVAAPTAGLHFTSTLLQQLASATNGRVFRPEEADALESLLTAQTVRRVTHQAQPLWRWWVILAALVGLLSAEWIIRKLGGLP